jgi:hypothetical protein
MTVFHSANHMAERLGKGLEDWSADTLKFMLSNTLPLATYTLPSQITQITGGGYVAGGYAFTRTTEYDTDGVWGQLAENVEITPSGASWTFQYVPIYNDTKTVFMGWWDLEAELTFAAGVPLAFEPDAVLGLIGVRKVA